LEIDFLHLFLYLKMAAIVFDNIVLILHFVSTQTEARSVGPVFARCKRANRRRCMWAYLVGLSVLALILVTSHLPRSGFNPTTFVDNDDPVESGE
jgi:hypothetical protein